MNRNEDKPELVQLTDLAIDWRFDADEEPGRPIYSGPFSRLWAWLRKKYTGAAEMEQDQKSSGSSPDT